MPYKDLELLPVKYEEAGYPHAAVQEARQITADFASELRRIELAMIDAVSGKLSEDDLDGLIAFAKSELGRKLRQGMAEKRADLKLTPEEQKQLRGFAKISWAWKFAGIPRRLEPIKGEMEKSLRGFTARMEDIKRRYPPETMNRKRDAAAASPASNQP